MTDTVNNPDHYKQASVPLEPIDVLRYAPFDLGNCLKYIIRAGHKGDKAEDIAKAKKYFDWVEDSALRGDAEPYSRFFERYGLLLKKFKRFERLSISEFLDNTLESLGCVLYDLEKGNLE